MNRQPFVRYIVLNLATFAISTATILANFGGGFGLKLFKPSKRGKLPGKCPG